MRKKKYIELPTGCLSYSQVSLWLSSPKRYKKLFFEQDESMRFMNDAMRYGSLFADALEHDKPTGDLMTDMVISMLEKYDIKDEEMTGEYITKAGWLKIVSHPDGVDSKTKSIIEYKTGMVKWTQKKADNWFQIKFYAMLIYIIHGVVTPKAQLIWAETFRDTDGEIKPTGHVESFEVKIDMKLILETMAIVTKAAKEIELEWLSYVPEVNEFTTWISK